MTSLPTLALDSRSFVTTDGVALHYLTAGAGRTLVFVPGWSMPAQIWKPQLDFFAQDYRVVALDPRSQGESQIATGGHNPERRARDIAELIDQLGPDPVVLVGWSLGVLEALYYVRHYGDARLAGLVLVDNSVGEDPPPKPSSFLKGLRANRDATVRSFVRAMYRTPQPEDYLERISGYALKTPLEAQIQLLSYAVPRNEWREALYGTRKPVLYVVTERFRGQAGNVARHHASAQIEIFDAAGHALFVDEADRFNRTLAQFLVRRVWP